MTNTTPISELLYMAYCLSESSADLYDFARKQDPATPKGRYIHETFLKLGFMREREEEKARQRKAASERHMEAIIAKAERMLKQPKKKGA